VLVSSVNENKRGIPSENKNLVTRYRNGIGHSGMIAYMIHHPVHHVSMDDLSKRFVDGTAIFSFPFMQSSSFAW